MATQTDLDLGKLVARGKDLFLSHAGADKPWVEALAAIAVLMTKLEHSPPTQGKARG